MSVKTAVIGTRNGLVPETRKGLYAYGEGKKRWRPAVPAEEDGPPPRRPGRPRGPRTGPALPQRCIDALSALGGEATAIDVHAATVAGGYAGGQRNVTRALKELAAADPPAVERVAGKVRGIGGSLWYRLASGGDCG